MRRSAAYWSFTVATPISTRRLVKENVRPLSGNRHPSIRLDTAHPNEELRNPQGLSEFCAPEDQRPSTYSPRTIRRTWPWMMENFLLERGFEAEVFNAGFPGWTSLENLISLSIRDLDLEPDIVVLYQGINNLQPASHRPFDSQYERGHADEAVRALGFDLQPLKWYERSLLVEKARELVVGKRNPWQRLQSPSAPDNALTELPAEALETFERNIRSFVAVAIAGGSRVVLVTQPMRIRSEHVDADEAYLAQWILGLDPVVAPAELERFNAVLREASMTGPALLADVAGQVAWEERDFDDPMHFSPDGSARMARVMADAVEKILEERGGAMTESQRTLDPRIRTTTQNARDRQADQGR